MTPSRGFSDEDLKRYRAYTIYDARPEHLFLELQALLARLEAAEEVIKDACVQENFTDCPELSDAKKAWRKAKGDLK